MTWFLIVFIQTSQCPGKCEPPPAMSIMMPDQATCAAVKALNADRALKCWG